MIRLFARCASAVPLLWLLACGPAAVAAAPPPGPPPAEGLMLLSLSSGAVVRQAALGADPLAVALASDGHTAYVADNDLGDVFALRLPSLQTAWRTHVGGRPSGLLVHGGSVYVSQYGAARVAALDRGSGRLVAEQKVAPRPGQLAWDGAVLTSDGDGFGVALAGGTDWTTDRLPPLPGAPFWLAAGRPNELLVTAEGSPEDTAAGAVASIDTRTGGAQILATPRDPDQAERFGDRVFVAAHGDRQVLVIGPRGLEAWARGAEVVALAPDPALGLLIVVTDAGE